jgi:hypothetical protein
MQPCDAADWRGLPNVRLPIPIAALRAQGRLGQLSARSGLYVELGGTPLPGSPADFGMLVADETEKWAKVIRAANIKAE